MSGEVEDSVQEKPDRDNPKAIEEANRSQSCKNSEEHDFRHELLATRHHGEQRVQCCDDSKYDGIE